jgi:type IV pilus assembly protein PilV
MATGGCVRVPRRMHGPQRMRGFSLIEVLISVTILSFGLLGMVGLQAVALQGSRDARLQGDAVSLAREIAEVMRGNKDVALRTSGNPYLGAFASPMVLPAAAYCLNVGTSPCTGPIAIANAEMTEWLARVDRVLPGARIAICLDDKPFDTAGLPQWPCTYAGASGTMYIKIGWTRPSTDRSSSNASPMDSATRPSIVLPITAGSTV